MVGLSLLVIWKIEYLKYNILCTRRCSVGAFRAILTQKEAQANYPREPALTSVTYEPPCQLAYINDKTRQRPKDLGEEEHDHKRAGIEGGRMPTQKGKGRHREGSANLPAHHQPATHDSDDSSAQNVGGMVNAQEDSREADQEYDVDRGNHAKRARNREDTGRQERVHRRIITGESTPVAPHAYI
jgi:hypothetical protein